MRVRRPAGDTRPDAAPALMLGAFFLGIVIAAAGAAGLQIAAGDTVSARLHRATTEQLAASDARADAERDRLAEQADALDDARRLQERLIAAIGSPGVAPAVIEELRREVARQSSVIERVRVVRVPVPGPTVTAVPGAQRPQPARQDRPSPRPAPAPSPSPSACALELLGTCLAR